MKIWTWNVKGLGRPPKCFLVKELLRSARAEVVCLQETKLQNVHQSLWRSFGHRLLDTYEYLHSFGSIGGIIISWDSTEVSGSLLYVGSFSLSVKFSNCANNFV